MAGTLAAIAFCGCTTVRPTVFPDVVVPSSPANDEEKVIAEAIRRAVVDQKDIPGYSNLADTDTIIVKCEFGHGAGKRGFAAGALPHTDDVHFRLMTLTDIDRLRKIYGRIHYLMVEDLEISGDVATIDIQLASVSWYPATESSTWLDGAPGMFASAGYILQFRRQGDTWRPCNESNISIHYIN